MRAGGPIIAVCLVVLLSGSALAFTFGPMGVFASTRPSADGYQVQWTANVTIETNSLLVKTTEVVIGSQAVDIKPDGLQRVNVYLTRYSLDHQTYRVTMLAGARTGLNVTYSNSGQALKVFEGGVNTKTCAAEVTPCSWVFTNATDFNFSVLTPTGVQQLTGETPAPAPPAGGGGGGGDAPAAAPAEAKSILDLPSPVDLFPRFTPWRWLALIVSFGLFLNGFPATRAVLPIRIPVATTASLFVGAAGLALVYLTPT